MKKGKIKSIDFMITKIVHIILTCEYSLNNDNFKMSI